MATNVILVDSAQTVADDTIEEFYTSPAGGEGTLITAFTATNNTGANRYYTAFIYNELGELVEAVIPLTIIIRDKFRPGSAIVNHMIPPGGTLRMSTDQAASIAFRVTGKEL